MNQYCVKVEECTTFANVNTPKILQSTQSQFYNRVAIQKYQNAVQKLLKAIKKLQVSQIHPSQNLQPTYPYIMPYSYNEFLVYLDEKAMFQIHNSQTMYHHQPQIMNCYPQNTQSPSQTIKLPIQKKRTVNLLQDQKDTKNIPKNYCKAIITFASKNHQLCLEILKDHNKVIRFLEKITAFKKQLLNIKTFSGLLQSSDDPEEEEFRKAFRILSRIFIKKYAINYIFNSKIVQHNWHMRYRQQIYKGVKNPNQFSHIKNL